jgi:4-hydroxybutyryl-CoA dehydratase/vinylacetyl-CoA-Delta-isomerase
MLMAAADYRESLRCYRPRVFVDGRRVEAPGDDPTLTPGVNAISDTYDFALMPEHQALMLAEECTSGATVNRMLHLNATG